MISIIILTYNEEKSIVQALSNIQLLQSKEPFETIVADGGSSDKTLALIDNQAIIVQSGKGKAKQMNAGANIATGDILFFVHADMSLAPTTLLAIQANIDNKEMDGGGFANIFDRNNDKIKRLGNILNFRFFDKREQSDKGIFYGDNGIFVKKSIFHTLGGFKEIPIMEDYDFSIRMSSKYKTVKIYEPPITVSARRHEKAGFIKTRLQWIIIKKLYLLGISPHLLNRWYRDIR
jgi:Glycosyltransferases, probably involved in cell wall biogenesis